MGYAKDIMSGSRGDPAVHRRAVELGQERLIAPEWVRLVGIGPGPEPAPLEQREDAAGNTAGHARTSASSGGGSAWKRALPASSCLPYALDDLKCCRPPCEPWGLPGSAPPVASRTLPSITQVVICDCAPYRHRQTEISKTSPIGFISLPSCESYPGKRRRSISCRIKSLLSPISRRLLSPLYTAPY